MTIMSNSVAQTSASVVEFLTTQPSDQSLARVFLGSSVTNSEGQTVGDINDLMFDKAGQISTVVIGVGGFLGMGEKTIAVPFSKLTISPGANGSRTVMLNTSKAALSSAPAFIATEKTTMDSVRDRAADLGHKTAEKANELKEQAAKKLDDMTKGTAINK